MDDSSYSNISEDMEIKHSENTTGKTVRTVRFTSSTLAPKSSQDSQAEAQSTSTMVSLDRYTTLESDDPDDNHAPIPTREFVSRLQCEVTRETRDTVVVDVKTLQSQQKTPARYNNPAEYHSYVHRSFSLTVAFDNTIHLIADRIHTSGDEDGTFKITKGTSRQEAEKKYVHCEAGIRSHAPTMLGSSTIERGVTTGDERIVEHSYQRPLITAETSTSSVHYKYRFLDERLRVVGPSIEDANLPKLSVQLFGNIDKEAKIYLRFRVEWSPIGCLCESHELVVLDSLLIIPLDIWAKTHLIAKDIISDVTVSESMADLICHYGDKRVRLMFEGFVLAVDAPVPGAASTEQNGSQERPLDVSSVKESNMPADSIPKNASGEVALDVPGTADKGTGKSYVKEWLCFKRK